MFSFYSLYIHWKIFLSERIFYFRKPFAKATCSFSFYCASSLFSFYFSHSLLKNTDLYLNFCMLVSVCMFSEDSRRSENFPFPFFVSTSTHGSWLCCSAVWKISSQILTEINKVDIEDATMLNSKKCIVFLSCTRYVCFVLLLFFWRGRGVDDGAPVTAANQNFFCLRNLEIHSLFLLIPVDL